MSNNETEPKWKERLLEWQASGKSIGAWCREQQIPATTVYGWKNRLKKLSQSNQQTTATKSQSLETLQEFVELKDNKPAEAGIVLECSGIRIHLMDQFNPLTLKQCVSCLRGGLC